MAPLHNQIERRDRSRLFRSAHQGHRAVQFQQLQIGVEVVIRGDRIENEVKAFRMLLHSVGIFGDDHFVRHPAAWHPAILFGEVVNSTTCAPNALANFTPMCPSPPRPTTPTFWPLPTFQ